MSEGIPAYARPCADPIVEAVRDRLRQRSLAGQAKYGASMDRGDLSLKDWLRHAQEEALDLAVYLERLQRESFPSVPTPGWWHCEVLPGGGWRWLWSETGPADPPNGWEAA
jgi:hypothetical protein